MTRDIQNAIAALNAAFDAGHVSLDDWHTVRDALGIALRIGDKVARSAARASLADLEDRRTTSFRKIVPARPASQSNWTGE
jgi:hypothetical protein